MTVRATIAGSVLSLGLFVAGQYGYTPYDPQASAGPTAGELMRRFQSLVGAPAPAVGEPTDLAAASVTDDTIAQATVAESSSNPDAAADRSTPGSGSVRRARVGGDGDARVAMPAPARGETEPALRPLTGTVVVRATTTVRRSPSTTGRDDVRVPAGVVADVVGVTLDGRWYRIAGPERRYLSTDAARPKSIQTERGAVNVDELLAGIEQVEVGVRRARFEESIEAAATYRLQLSRLRDWGGLAEPAARLELAAATARLAIGEMGAARAALARSLSHDPKLELDPKTTSPKLVRLFETVRALQ